MKEKLFYSTQPILKEQVIHASNEQRALKPEDLLETRIKLQKEEYKKVKLNITSQ